MYTVPHETRTTMSPVPAAEVHIALRQCRRTRYRKFEEEEEFNDDLLHTMPLELQVHVGLSSCAWSLNLERQERFNDAVDREVKAMSEGGRRHQFMDPNDFEANEANRFFLDSLSCQVGTQGDDDGDLQWDGQAHPGSRR